MFIQATLKWPTSAQLIQSNSEEVTDLISTELNNAVARLTPLKNVAAFSRHSLSVDAENLLGLRAELDKLLTQGQVLTASAYMFQVGETYASGCYLNPQKAIDVLVAKLRDKNDINCPTNNLNLHCIVLIVCESQQNIFASKLTDLTKVLPIPELCQVARQATALSTNSVDKLCQPSAISQPRFKPPANLNANPLRELLKQQGMQIATLESLANDKTSVIDKLQALANKRMDKLSGVNTAINALKTLTGGVWSMSLSGTTESIAAQISLAGVPNNNQHTVASLLLCTEPLTFFEELLCSH